MPPTVPAGGYELDALTDRERQIPLPMVNSIDLLFAQQIRALNQEQPVLMSAQRPSQIRTGNDSCGQMHRVRRPQAAPLANVVATSAVTGWTVRRSSHPSNPASAATSSADPSRIGFAKHLRQQQHRAHSRQRVPPPAGTTPLPTVPAGGPPHPCRSTRRHRSIHHRSRSARTASAQSCACSTLTTGAGNARSRPADTSAAISPYE